MIDKINNLMKCVTEIIIKSITIPKITKRIYLFQVDMTIDPHLPWELDFATISLKGHGHLQTYQKCKMLEKIMHVFILSLKQLVEYL